MRSRKVMHHCRLRVEELEPRDLLAAVPVTGPVVGGAAIINTDVDGGVPANSAFANLYGSGAYIAQVNPVVFFLPVNLDATIAAQAGFAPGSPDAASGVGQMTITNGQNTPGIGSFATATLGSAAGGTGGPTEIILPRDDGESTSALFDNQPTRHAQTSRLPSIESILDQLSGRDSEIGTEYGEPKQVHTSLVTSH